MPFLEYPRAFKCSLVASVIVSSLVLALGLICYKPASLLVVDMTAAIQKPAVMLSHSKLTPKEQSEVMRRFSALLPEVIKDYGTSHKVTVVAGQVFASHNKADITDAIVELTIARMTHES